MIQQLIDGLNELAIVPPTGAVTQMIRYADLLLAQNKVMNLTSITEPEQVVTLHFLDSAALLTCAEFSGKTLIDVGTGAGFPGLVLKLLIPDLKLTLLDSLKKRLDWLGTVCADLGLQDVTLLHARAEEQGLQLGRRDFFDFAVARAVADLRNLSELCLPLVRPGGQFLAMKAVGCEDEVIAADNIVKILGGRLLPSRTYRIPGTVVERKVILIEKRTPTPPGYPRRWAKIQKQPL